jgi:hypothetical protein
MLFNNMYTLEWFSKNLCLDKNPSLLFKASDFKIYKKELKNRLGVYAIFSIKDQKYYIGSSVNLYTRLSEHLNYYSASAKKKEGKFNSNKNLRAALIKNGIENFYIMILAFVDSQNDSLHPRVIDPRVSECLEPRVSECLEPRVSECLEPRVSECLEPRVSDSGYSNGPVEDLTPCLSNNVSQSLYISILDIEDYYLQQVPKEKLFNIALNSINTSGLSHRHTIEARIKMSIASMGNVNGRGNKGYKHSEETRHKMSMAQMGHQRPLGLKRSEEAKEKMRLAQQARRQREKDKKQP